MRHIELPDTDEQIRAIVRDPDAYVAETRRLRREMTKARLRGLRRR